jgi:hypothetical protein
MMLCGPALAVRDEDHSRLARAYVLAATLEMLSEDAELRDELGAPGRKPGVDEFDEREIVRRLARLYESIARHETGTPAPPPFQSPLGSA